MKLHPEDPRLTAYLLGELGAEEAAAVERAVAQDPALQAAVAELNSVQAVLGNRLAVRPNVLLPSQRESILAAAREADRSCTTSQFPAFRWWKPAAISFSAAAALILGFVLAPRFAEHRSTVAAASRPQVVKESAPPISVPVPTPSPAPIPVPEAAPEPTPAVAVSEPIIPSHPPRSLGSVSVADSPTLALPIVREKSNIAGIFQTIRTEQKLPPRDAVRLEQILNSFPIRLNGLTSIARVAKTSWHPDNRDDGMTTHAATLSTETLPCPWKPSATLLLISIRGNPSTDCNAKVFFRPNAANVFHYRLLGYQSPDTEAAEEVPTLLPAKWATTLAIEIEPSTPKGELGTLEWSVEDEPAASVSVNRSGDTEPSDDARFASLVCTYANWLAGEEAGIIDSDLLSGLAREIKSANLPADRADFLELIEQSLRL